MLSLYPVLHPYTSRFFLILYNMQALFYNKNMSYNIVSNKTQINCRCREGNGNPLQYSCLENPMDGGACWATVHEVTKNRTRLRDFTFMHWRRKRQPTPVFLPGEPQGQRSLVGCHLRGRTESDTPD